MIYMLLAPLALIVAYAGLTLLAVLTVQDAP
jgi:hypothetical protein